MVFQFHPTRAAIGNPAYSRHRRLTYSSPPSGPATQTRCGMLSRMRRSCAVSNPDGAAGSSVIGAAPTTPRVGMGREVRQLFYPAAGSGGEFLQGVAVELD